MKNQSLQSGNFFNLKLASLAVGIFLFCGHTEAQPCNVSGGIVATSSNTINLCLNDGSSHVVQLTVAGNAGIGRFGLAEAHTGKVVAVNTTGLFDMTAYKAGNYQAGYVSVDELSTLSGVTHINQLMGCYALSNVIPISSIFVHGGSISALGSTYISGGPMEFEVTGASGPNKRWALLNEQGSEILTVQTEGIFNFDNYPDGTYRVAHGAFGPGMNMNSIDPQNLEGCIDASNLVTVMKSQSTSVVEVVNPATGRIWMDRNLGASQVATSPSDSASYGDLYQWGRGDDGHEKRNSPTTNTLSNSDHPGHGHFILVPDSPFDWRSSHNNNLWVGADGINNPCPDGFRIPTAAEWEEERLGWGFNNATTTFLSPLNLPAAGSRNYYTGESETMGIIGNYWSTSVSGVLARNFSFFNIYIHVGSGLRASGMSVRCIKD